MMTSLEKQTPLPMLPTFDNATTAPMAPKRSRGSSVALNRRVRANLNVLCIPDIRSSNNTAAPLQLQMQPQGKTAVDFQSILLGGAMRNRASKAKLILTAKHNKPIIHHHSHKSSPNSLRTPVERRFLPGPPPQLKGGKNANMSLLSLRMAAMLKGSVDAKAQLKFGTSLGGNKSFAVPGRSLSSPYRPSRATINRNRSFNALCA